MRIEDDFDQFVQEVVTFPESETFKEGDIICHTRNMYGPGFGPIFKRATWEDVDGWSGKNGLYIIVTEEFAKRWELIWEYDTQIRKKANV